MAQNQAFVVAVYCYAHTLCTIPPTKNRYRIFIRPVLRKIALALGKTGSESSLNIVDCEVVGTGLIEILPAYSTQSITTSASSLPRLRRIR